MKKILFSIVALILSLSASAQFKGGFYAGINGSQVDGDNYVGFYKLGLNLGATVFYPLSPRFSASMEILFSQKGAQAKHYDGYPQQMLLKLNYIEVPILINYHDNTKGKDKFTISLGTSVSRLVNDTLIIAFPMLQGLTKPEIQSLHGFDWGVVVGGAYNLTDRWQVNVRYSYSIIQMGESLNSNYLNKGLFNNVVSFRIGYIIQGKVR